jgi:hypothetical protein
MKKRWVTHLLATSWVAIIPLAGPAGADALDQVLKIGDVRLAEAQTSQKKIDALASDTRDKLEEYKQVLKQNEGLTVYINRLDAQIEDQIQRLQDIEASIEQVTVVQRQMPLLIERMIDALEEFIALDLPFYVDEREERVEFLRANLSRSDLTVAEKFRQVMEAYSIENEYGRKISTFKSAVALQPGVSRDVTLLQIGRVALMYQTTDAQSTGAWDTDANSWVELDSRQYKNAIRQAIRIAQNQAAKDILTVPVAAAELVK